MISRSLLASIIIVVAVTDSIGYIVSQHYASKKFHTGFHSGFQRGISTGEVRSMIKILDATCAFKNDMTKEEKINFNQCYQVEYEKFKELVKG